MIDREKIKLFLSKNGVETENLTEKEMLKILKSMFEKCKIDIDCLEISYQKNPLAMTSSEYVDMINYYETKKTIIQGYLLQAMQLQKDNRILKRKQVIYKIKTKILGNS